MESGCQGALEHVRSVAFIVARLGSSRLPGKQLRKIGDKKLIEWLVEELKRSRQIDEIVLATLADPENDPLVTWCAQHGVSVYRYPGDVNHVTTRLRRAAERFSAEICVLVSGDCPLVHAPAIDEMISALKSHPEADFIAARPGRRGHYPALQGISVARLTTWQRADDLSGRPALKEHHFPILHQKPGLFACLWIPLPEYLYVPFRHRYSVDTWADLEFHNRLHDDLIARGDVYSMPAALNYLCAHPSLLSINAHVHQKEIEEKSRQALMVVDAGPEAGYGHLMRCRELALQLTERLGVSVTFAVSDPAAIGILSAVGLRVQRPGGPGLKTDGVTAERAPFPGFPQAGTPPDLIVLDLSPASCLEPGWRKRLPDSSAVVVLDRLDAWTREADLIVIPGITGSLSREQMHGPGPEIVKGRNFIILRREVRHLADGNKARDIDLLVYLHHTWQQDLVDKFAASCGLRAHILRQHSREFYDLLARSRVFISGFGIATYEALAVGSYPLTWAFSESHRQDARQFYRKLELPELVLPVEAGIEELSEKVRQALDLQVDITIGDGTPNIVARLQRLMERRQL